MLQQLQKDEFLNHETVDDAVAQLRRGLPAETSEPGMTPPHKGTKAMMTGREAAEFLGTTEGTLSRWRNATPAWASSNPRLFGHLISRDAGRYSKMNIHLLGRWFAQAQERGLQTPTDCP